MAMVSILGGLLLAQAWVADISGRGWSEPPQEDSLVQAYTDALAAGQAHLKIQPDPRLLALPNPYDPEANQGYRLLDASLYDRRYYVYFGIVPFLGLLVPWLKVTGTHLSAAAATWLCCSIGLVAYGMALWMVWRRWHADVSGWAFGAALGALATASGTCPLLVHPLIYEFISASGYACFAIAVMSLVAAETNPARRRPWFTVTALAAGLTMGCRPNYAPAVIVVCLWMILRVWQADRGNRARAFGLLAALGPLVIIGVLLAAWNYVRFNNPLEFGFRYQLMTQDRPTVGFFGLRHLFYNLHRYLLGLPRLGAYFPFIEGELPGPFALPPGHDPANQLYGCLWFYPILLFALLPWSRRRRGLSADTGGILSALILAALGNLLVLSCLGAESYRYPTDFLGPLSFVSAAGLLDLSKLPRGMLRRQLLAWAALAMLWSAAASVCLTASIWSYFATARPDDLALLARPFNSLVYAWERLRGDGPRALRITVQLPPDRWGQEEPLVVMGPQSVQDFLYAYYVMPGHLQVGFESIGHGGPVSQILPVDYAQPHTIDLWYGSFLPPDDHPLLGAMSPADRALERRMITVRFDGRPLLDGWADFHPPQGLVFIGRSPFDAAFGAEFTGRILKVDQPRLTARGSGQRWQAAAYGPLELGVTLAPATEGMIEPLVMLGHRNQGEALLLRRLSDHRVQLGWERYGGETRWGEAFAWPDGATSMLVVRWGALLPPIGSSLWLPTATSSATDLKSNLVVELDGRVVFHATVLPFDPSPTTLALGENRLQLSSVVPQLDGNVRMLGRLPWP